VRQTAGPDEEHAFAAQWTKCHTRPVRAGRIERPRHRQGNDGNISPWEHDREGYPYAVVEAAIWIQRRCPTGCSQQIGGTLS